MTRKVRLEPLLPWPASPHGNRVCLQHHAYVLLYFPQMPWMPWMHCAKHLLMNLLAGWCFCSGPGSLGDWLLDGRTSKRYRHRPAAAAAAAAG